MSILGVPVQELLIRIPVLLLVLTVHEVSHGYVAMRLGDPTARNFGRLSMNPLKHIDPLGALCMVFFRFGWAKPVPINIRHFKNPRRDLAISAAAGPVSNLLMAFVGVIVFYFSAYFIGFRGEGISLILRYSFIENILPSIEFADRFQFVWLLFVQTFVFMNLSLGFFNLIPVPPLDGSRIFLQFLPAKYYFAVMKYEQYIKIALLFLLYKGVVSLPLEKLILGTLSLFEKLITLIPIF